MDMESRPGPVDSNMKETGVLGLPMAKAKLKKMMDLLTKED